MNSGEKEKSVTEILFVHLQRGNDLYVIKTSVVQSVTEILLGEYFETLLKYVLQLEKGFDIVKVHLQRGIDLYVTKTSVALSVAEILLVHLQRGNDLYALLILLGESDKMKSGRKEILGDMGTLCSFHVIGNGVATGL